jgi:hypothetical protein
VLMDLNQKRLLTSIPDLMKCHQYADIPDNKTSARGGGSSLIERAQYPFLRYETIPPIHHSPPMTIP